MRPEIWDWRAMGSCVCSVICQVHTKIFVAVKTGPISDATVVIPRVLYLGGPCAGLHRGRLAQSVPVGVLSSAWVVSKALHLSQKSCCTCPAGALDTALCRRYTGSAGASHVLPCAAVQQAKPPRTVTQRPGGSYFACSKP